MSSAKSSDRPTTGLPTTDPEEAGFSPERLARIGPAMQKYIDARLIPGVLTLVARHGRIVHLESRGLMDIEANKTVSSDTVYRIMSMTKPIACVALMILYEEGHFLLDQPISRYLPSFKKMVVKGKHDLTEPANREITFRDCMTHTAGFSAQKWAEISGQARAFVGVDTTPLIPGTKRRTVNLPSPQGTVEEAVELLSKAPLNFHPGTDWEYHPGHDVVGVLIEKISGKSLDIFLQERILDPLKMTDTHFYLPKEKAARLPALYTTQSNKWGMLGLLDSPASSAKIAAPKTYFSAGGGLLSTAADYSRFAQMLLNAGILDGARILSRKTIELMTTSHTGDIVISKGAGYGYGLGVSVRLNLSGTPLVGSVGTYGWSGAYTTHYFADPKEDLFGLLFTQVLSPPQNPLLPIRPDFERMVYQALVGV